MRISRSTLCFALLVIVGGIAGSVTYHLVTRPTHAIVAELRVRPQEPLLIDRTPIFAGDVRTELELYAETTAQLIRSRSVLTKALRSPNVANLEILKEHEDPEAFLVKHLLIDAQATGLIEVSMRCRGEHLDDFQVIVNAVVEEFISAASARERDSLSGRSRKLEQMHEKLREEEERERTVLEHLAEQLGDESTAPAFAVTMDSHLFRLSRARIEALADEIAQTELAIVQEKDDDQDKLAETLKKLNEQYDRQLKQYSDDLSTQYAKSAPRHFIAIDLKKKDIERLSKQIDRIADAIFRVELALESKGRVELISPAAAVEL